MTNEFRAMCAELVAAVDDATESVDRTSDCVNVANYPELWAECMELIRKHDGLLTRARALLAQPEPVAPTDEEIMELMPQQMRDDLAAAARALAGHFDTSAPIKATGAIRIILNRHAVDHARAVLAKWGNQ